MLEDNGLRVRARAATLCWRGTPSRWAGPGPCEFARLRHRRRDREQGRRYAVHRPENVGHLWDQHDMIRNWMSQMLARLRLRPTSRVECAIHSRWLGLAHRRNCLRRSNRDLLAKSVQTPLLGMSPLKALTVSIRVVPE